MEAAESQEQKPSLLQRLKVRTRWLLFVLLVFGLQLAFILLLSDERILLRKPAPGPRLSFATRGQEILELSDPTVFALPHRRGFSGQAWLQKTAPPDHWFEWTEEPRWLKLAPDDLGHAGSQNVEGGQFEILEVLGGRPPRPTVSSFSAPNLFRQRSEMRVQGDLANRPLLAKVPLTDWPWVENLTNTIVAVRVDAQGMVISTMLLASSRSREADQYALMAARSARFTPLSAERSGNAQRSMTGELVFLWHALPAETTNNPAGEK